MAWKSVCNQSNFRQPRTCQSTWVEKNDSDTLQVQTRTHVAAGCTACALAVVLGGVEKYIKR